MNGNIELKTLMIGDLIAPDMDCFIMGDAQCVIKIDHEKVWCERYHMAERFPFPSWDAIIDLKDICNWWTRHETLTSWRERLK